MFYLGGLSTHLSMILDVKLVLLIPQHAMDGCMDEYTSSVGSFWTYIGHRYYTAGKAWEHVVMQHCLIKDLTEENRKLSCHG